MRDESPDDDSHPDSPSNTHIPSYMMLQQEEQHADEFALIRRKRPRSPPAADQQQQQRLLSFANFTSAVLDAHRPAPVAPAMVLPRISQLLSSQSCAMAPAASRQRISESGDFVERVHGSPLPSIAATTCAEDDDDDDTSEIEDKTPWPSANQYHDIFSNMSAHSNIPVYDLGVDPRGVPLHPEFIYSEPVSCMYFLKCSQLLGKGSFGFPRKKKAAGATESSNKKGSGAAAAKGKKESSKDFEWRKMSFVTGLPKKQPIVRYITATCYSRATDVSTKKKVFRMHAVMLADATGNGEMGDYVLVHIRAGGSKRVGLRASASEMDPQTNVSAPSSPGAPVCEDTSDDVKRPVSPPLASVSSYNSQAASTSPHNKKLLHADFSASTHHNVGKSPSFGKFMMPRSPPQMHQQPSHSAAMMRHPMMTTSPTLPTVAAPTFDVSKFNNARQVMRDMILQSCSSRDEMAKYVHCLQEELAALQRQTSSSN
ncbi:hypothetical protein FI667_g9540, partial [Globisporangium splendens]